jgi:serine/threonine-protein kinase HipA
MTDAKVVLWGTEIGAVSWVEEREIGVFQYSPEFIPSGIQLSPLAMPLREYPYEFLALPRETFRGLPGLLADSLPDKFGNSIINAWLASQGRTQASFNPVERLCTIGKRGMGGLEYEPAISMPFSTTKKIEIANLVEISNRILDQRSTLHGILSGRDDQKAMEDILRVGTSAGGARAKAILAWNPVTNEFRSGQVTAPPGFEYWILKFDGINRNHDRDVADPQGFGKIEFAYSLMAVEAGIKMMPCRLHHEGGRSHFMTKRFDRNDDGTKIHMQSLGALTHIDFNQPAGFSYEEALQSLKRINVPQKDLEQLVLRAMFNVVGRNQDDHVKNIACLMDRNGAWILSPAFDLTYSFNPNSKWTSRHQMSLNGKLDQFVSADFVSLAELGGIKAPRALEMLAQVIQTIKRWPEFAVKAGVIEKHIQQIQASHRTSLLT